MSITPESVKTLITSQDFGDRLRAINQMRQLDPAIGFELVQPLIADGNVRVRYSAACFLASVGEVNPPQALPLLRLGLRDPEPDVQAAAADAIGALKLTEAFEDLHHLYHSTDEWIVKFSIAAALGELGDRRAFDLLQESLESDNELLQTVAIGALGELGDIRAVPLLTPYADSSDWQIRQRVAQALRLLGTADARPALEQLAEDDIEQVAAEAKRGLD